MCGIVGLLIKKPALRESLGKFAVPMMDCMGDRGEDSAGLAVFTDPIDRAVRRFSLYAPQRDYDWNDFATMLKEQTKTPNKLESIENHAAITTAIHPDSFNAFVTQYDPALHVLSVGRSIDVYKDLGHPCELAKRYHFEKLNGSHLVGHTRMATESAVTPAHSHPFTAGEDFCLVHNGSLSNPYSLRRMLEKHGIHFETDNDTEAACRFLEWRMRSGEDLKTALLAAFKELDGFYTLLMGTATELVLVRDAFACKPAVVAEHNDYVAVSSEFRSMAHLPGIQNARIFEPQPEDIHVWTV